MQVSCWVEAESTQIFVEWLRLEVCAYADARLVPPTDQQCSLPAVGPILQRLPRGVVLRHSVRPRQLAGRRAQARVRGTRGGAAGGQGGAAGSQGRGEGGSRPAITLSSMVHTAASLALMLLSCLNGHFELRSHVEVWNGMRVSALGGGRHRAAAQQGCSCFAPSRGHQSTDCGSEPAASTPTATAAAPPMRPNIHCKSLTGPCSGGGAAQQAAAAPQWYSSIALPATYPSRQQAATQRLKPASSREAPLSQPTRWGPCGRLRTPW